MSTAYYLEYLKRTEAFPQSVYHSAKHKKTQSLIEDFAFPSCKILDAACGIGHITAPYCALYPVTGLDEQVSAVNYAKEHYKGEYLQGSLYGVPFADNTFDLIFFLDAIEHFTEPKRALKELSRVLKPQGRILICTINYANPLWFILENTWHRFFGGNCKAYALDVHPTRYTTKLLRSHCRDFFNEISFEKRVLRMELFYVGQKKV